MVGFCTTNVAVEVSKSGSLVSLLGRQFTCQTISSSIGIESRKVGNARVHEHPSLCSKHPWYRSCCLVPNRESLRVDTKRTS